MIRLALAFFSTSALAHPGHGALEIHWHFEDIAWVLLAVVVLGVGYLVTRKRKP